MGSVRHHVLNLAVVVALFGGCSSAGDGAASAADETPRFALLLDDAWVLQRATDLAPSNPISELQRPPVDWFAEYDGGSSSQPIRVLLTGHEVDFQTARSELERSSFRLDDVVVDGREAAGGFSPGDTGGPTLVVMDLGDASLVVLSYELGLEELAEVAADVEPVAAEDWLEASQAVG